MRVNGSGQQKYLKQDGSVASPTTSLDSLFVTLLINAYEGCNAAITGVLGGYIQVTLSPNARNERVLMKLEGDFVNIMIKINPKHAKNATFKNGNKLYLEILQTIYGWIESALRWYEFHSQTLVK